MHEGWIFPAKIPESSDQFLPLVRRREYNMAESTPNCNDLISSGPLLDYITGFQLELCEKSGPLLLTLPDNILNRSTRDWYTQPAAASVCSVAILASAAVTAGS